jgi:LysM repeat protein
MVSNNEVLHTVSDLRTGIHTQNLSNFIQDLQQQRAQNPQETQQFLAACNSNILETRGFLPGLQIEGLNKQGDRVVLKTSRGIELSMGIGPDIRPLQPGEMGNGRPESTVLAPDTTPKQTDTTPKPKPPGDTKTTGGDSAGKGGDTDYNVKEGDCLWRIARKHLGEDASAKDVYALVKAIAKENGMSKINQTIYPDQTLKIPGDGSQTTTPNAKPADATTPTPQTRPADATPRPQTKPAAADSTPQPTPDDAADPTQDY